MRFAIASLILVFSLVSFAGSDVLLDVRTAAEYSEAHLVGSANLDVKNESAFLTEIAKLDKSKSYKVYCRSGNRSGIAAEILKKNGFTNVENIGGLKDLLSTGKYKCEGKSC
jgi:phage shock protein E